MGGQAQPERLNPRLEEVLALRKCWVWFLALGIVGMLLGAAALGAGFVATLATVVVFGSFLVASGVVQIVNAVLARHWKACFLHLLVGVLHLVLGGLLIEHPVPAAEDLTLVLALTFLVGGGVRILTCLLEQFPGWGWVLLNGVVTALLGLAIWRSWPASSLWVIGTFVGIDLLFSGWSWVMLGLTVKAARPVSAPPVAG